MTDVLAIDIGGTKIAAGLVGDDGSVRLDREVPTDQTSAAAVAPPLEGWSATCSPPRASRT